MVLSFTMNCATHSPVLLAIARLCLDQEWLERGREFTVEELRHFNKVEAQYSVCELTGGSARMNPREEGKVVSGWIHLILSGQFKESFFFETKDDKMSVVLVGKSE